MKVRGKCDGSCPGRAGREVNMIKYIVYLHDFFLDNVTDILEKKY